MSALKRIAGFTGVLLLIYSALRLLFFIVNHQLFTQSSASTILFAFLDGLRYDFAAIAFLNIGIFLIYLLPFSRFKAPVLGLISALVNGFTLSVNVFDTEYFRFAGKRFTADNFLFAHDIGDQTLQIMMYYWYYSLLILALYVFIGWATYRFFRKPAKAHWTAYVIVGALFGLGIRGGLQGKPLIPANAFEREPSVGSLVLNSTFTLLKSTDKAAVVELHELSWDQVKDILSKNQSSMDKPLDAAWEKPKNVVVVILESFGSEYIFPPDGKPGYAPFIKSLAERGSYFSNAYANGRRSIDAMPAIYAGIPEWMEPPFINSPYQTNTILGTPQVFRDAGYDTVYFHGGNNGTMFFDAMAKRLGFASYIGADEYPDHKDYDGRWGIFDEPFLQFVVKSLSKETKPFLAGIFTLSSHHPYTIPKEHVGQFPKGSLEIHESVGYADYAVKRFYESAQKEPWFKDTLFVFTADHTSKQEYPENDNIPGRFHVPIILIMNDRPLHFSQDDLRKPVQHADLASTLIDLARLPVQARSHFGESLCRIERPGIILFESDGYHLVGNSQGLSWWRDGRTQTFPLLKREGTGSEIDSDKESNIRYLKAAAHYYNNGMVRNQLIW